MTTATAIVERSLRWLGIHTPTMPAPPETINEQFNNLVGMLNEWDANGVIITGLTIPTAITDDLGEPAWALVGIETNLAIYGSALFQIEAVSDRLAKAAKSSWRTILGQTMSPPDLAFPGVLPVGQGNTDYPRNRVFFPTPADLGEEGTP